MKNFKRTRRYCLLSLIILFSMLIIACGGGGGGGGNTSTLPDVSSTITAAGGTVQHPDGFVIEVEPNSVSADVECSITKTALPSSLPHDIQPASDAFKVNANSSQFAIPVTIRFNLSASEAQSSDGEIGIYRWNGSQWNNVGGHKENDTISTKVSGFSTFVLGTGKSLHKQVEFDNSGPNNAIALVAKYELAHPDMDAPIDENFSVVVWAPQDDRTGHQGMWLPQGSYQFCVEWDDYQGTWHKFIGAAPPASWSYVLAEKVINPTSVQFSTSTLNRIAGPCPPPAASAGVIDCSDGKNLVGNWLVFLQGYTPGGWHYYIDLKSDCTLTWESWVLWAPNGSGTGQWGYDSSTGDFWWSQGVTNISGKVTSSSATEFHVLDPTRTDGKAWEWHVQ